MSINIFEFTDYRQFLKAYYEAKKAGNPRFSFQVFSDKAGFPNKGFVHNVIHGIKNLSKSSIIKLSNAMELTKMEAVYFENLVNFNQVESHGERNHCFEKLNAVRAINSQGGNAKQVRTDQYEFYSKWHHSAIRSIIDMYGFKGNYRWLAKMIRPRISPWQAHKSVKLLLKLGLIVKRKNGTYAIADKSITTGKEVVCLAVQNFHIDCARLAEKAITDLSREERNISGLTLGMSKEAYQRICEETQEFQKKVMTIADADEEADRVYQFNFHLFPMSKFYKERKRI